MVTVIIFSLKAAGMVCPVLPKILISGMGKLTLEINTARNRRFPIVNDRCLMCYPKISLHFKYNQQ